MKSKTLFVLSITALLSLTSCGKSNNKKDEGLTDIEQPNMEVDFNEIADNSMVDAEIKNYIDAMEAQERTLEKPYHLTNLYGPTDYAMLASKDKSRSYGDVNKNYPASETGGVDCCQYLGYNSKDKNIPIVVSWDADGYEYEGAKVKYWSKKDFSDVREASVSVTDDVASASLENLFRATKYRMQIFYGDDVSQGFEFETGDYCRYINLGRVRNVRDIGGYMTSYGVRTNQGLMYRGYYVDDKSGGHGVNFSSDREGVVQETVLKIGYEVDLQRESEINGRTSSCFNTETTPCDYRCLTLISYENFVTQESYANLPAVFQILANAGEKHVYFHCWGGADRTGMLAFFINAICGVSYTDLIEDFEITTESNSSVRCHMHNSQDAAFSRFLHAFVDEWADYDPDATINENCYNWLKDVAQVPEEDMLKVRQLMIPGYYDGMPQNIPTYTASSEVQEDENGTWNPAVEDANVKCNYQRKN